MHLNTIDWLIVAIPLIIVTVIAFIVVRHVKSVADFHGHSGVCCRSRELQYFAGRGRQSVVSDATVDMEIWTLANQICRFGSAMAG